MCDQGCLKSRFRKPACEIWLGLTEAEPAAPAADVVLCCAVPWNVFQQVLLCRFFTHKHAISFFTPPSLSTFSPSTPLRASTHPSDSPSGQQHLGSNEIQERGNQRDLLVCVCMSVFVDTLYAMSIRPVPQDYYLVVLQRSQIREYDLFRRCTVLGIIIFCEIKKGIKAVSCPRAEIVVLWMHVLCPVNMICGLLLSSAAKVFFSQLSSIFKAGGLKYLNSK